MKNIYKVIIFSLLLSLLSFSGFAANTIEISDNTISELNRTVDVKFSAEGFTEGDDLTILVFKFTEELKTPDESNIVYVGQPEYLEDMQSLSFDLPDDAEGTYEIRVGGTDVSQYTVGKFTVGEIINTDLNNDGFIDKQDAVIILKVFFGKMNIDNKADFDFTKDENVDVKDAVRLLQLIK